MTTTRTPVLATLEVMLPDGTKQLVSLKNGDSVRAGRELHNDIVIEDSIVSREHAQFDCSSFGVVVTDLSSRNGTFLNGTRLTSMKDLNSKDVVDIGSARIVLNLRSSEALQKKSCERSARAMTAQLKPVCVTVMVARVQEYRDMLKQSTHPQLEAILAAWTDKIQDIVFRFGGRTDKTIEETMVALWVGDRPEVQVERAVQAARAIAGQGAAKVPGSKDFIPWNASAVIASGSGLSGTVGAASEANRFAMVGDPVNFAFALEEEIKTFGTSILLDEQTAQALPESIKPLLLGHSARLLEGDELPIFTIPE